MRKVLFSAAVLTALSLCSCSNSDASKKQQPQPESQTNPVEDELKQQMLIEPFDQEDDEEEEINDGKLYTEIIIVDDNYLSEEDEIKTVEDLMEAETDFGESDLSNPGHSAVDEAFNESRRQTEISDIYYYTEEEMPSFPGGQEAMYHWIKENLQYPEGAAERGAQGRVFVQFVVEKDGSISNVKVVRGCDPELDLEACRIAKSLPDFIPGKKDGEAVRVWFTLPINFKLAD